MIAPLIPHLLTTTQAAAIACQPWVGRGDKHAADDAATQAMRTSLNKAPINGRIVIGEGERDQAPMLYIGEQLGTGGPAIDIAVDPLEGTNLCAYDRPGAITTLTTAPAGALLHAPDTYMYKLVVGPAVTAPLSVDAPLTQTMQTIASSYDLPMGQVTVIVLKRSRHDALIQELYEIGVRVRLIDDGDVIPCLAVQQPAQTGIHAVIGVGAAPEGVLGASIVRCMGGQFLGRLHPYDGAGQQLQKAVIDRMATMGITDRKNRTYTAHDLVTSKDCCFIATAVTRGRDQCDLQSPTYHHEQRHTTSIIVTPGNIQLHRT